MIELTIDRSVPPPPPALRITGVNWDFESGDATGWSGTYGVTTVERATGPKGDETWVGRQKEPAVCVSSKVNVFPETFYQVQFAFKAPTGISPTLSILQFADTAELPAQYFNMTGTGGCMNAAPSSAPRRA